MYFSDYQELFCSSPMLFIIIIIIGFLLKAGIWFAGPEFCAEDDENRIFNFM